MTGRGNALGELVGLQAEPALRSRPFLARLVTVAGAGHAVVLEQPQVIAALALGFMAIRPAPAG